MGWVLAGNCIPLAGVLLDGWQALPLLVFYWVENVVHAAFAVLRMLVRTLAAGRTRTGLALPGVASLAGFASLLALFCFVHGMFIFATFALTDLIWHGREPLAHMDDLTGRLAAVFRADRGLLWSAALLLALESGGFLFRWLPGGDWRLGEPLREVAAPRTRIVVLHLTLLLSVPLVVALGETTLAVLALALVKSAADLGWPAFRRGAPGAR